VQLRYRGQSFELTVPAPEDAGDLVQAFHEAHRARYGYALDRAVELVTARLRATGEVEAAPPPVEPPEDGDAQVGRATAIFDGRAHGAAHYLRRRLRPGARLAGPALIIEYSATTVLPPDATAEVMAGGALSIVLK
jgi:N-methylhydantoinase A